MIRRARYTMQRWHDAVLIEDLCDSVGVPVRSVTNDAERVVRDLAERGIDVDRTVIVYRDTMGVWDQLLTRRGEFLGFYALGCNDGRTAAANALRSGRDWPWPTSCERHRYG